MTSTTSTSDLINSLNSAATQNASTVAANAKNAKSGTVGKDEFLTMLVTQLKNQDPLNPMDNQDFAVQLAQFSSLEQLTDINNKTGTSTSSGAGVASLASFLGKDVSVKTDDVDITNGDGGDVSFSIPTAVKGAKVELTALDGTVLKSVDAGALAAGEHNISLKGVDLDDGSYKVKITTTGYTGETANPDTQVSGTVTGLVPGDNPTLLVGSREVKVSDVTLVSQPATAAN